MADTKRKQGTYYLGRIICRGMLTKGDIIHTLKDAPHISGRQYNWTITDFHEHKHYSSSYYYGKLSKYEPQGEIDYIDPKAHKEKKKEAENIKAASSPFVFIPEYSGIAYLHVWNKIEQETFVRRFISLVTANKIMAECDIDSVSDLDTFYRKIADLTSINSIHAKVHPPNPLYGPLWEDLKNYLKKRNLAELKIDEKAEKGKKLLSNVKELIESMKQKASKQDLIPDIGDAAIIMATDGYGKGKISGYSGKIRTTIRTDDAIKTFQYDSDPDPTALYKVAEEVFKEISTKRYMKHDE